MTLGATRCHVGAVSFSTTYRPEFRSLALRDAIPGSERFMPVPFRNSATPAPPSRAILSPNPPERRTLRLEPLRRRASPNPTAPSNPRSAVPRTSPRVRHPFSRNPSKAQHSNDLHPQRKASTASAVRHPPPPLPRTPEPPQHKTPQASAPGPDGPKGLQSPAPAALRNFSCNRISWSKAFHAFLS